MLVAYNNNNERKIARDTNKNELPFTCPYCNEKVMLKKGEKKIHHFAHFPGSACIYSGETMDHLQAKLEIYDALCQHPNVKSVDLELFLEKSRPDIRFVLHNHSGVNNGVVVEIQNSVISEDDILTRENEYHRLLNALIWIITAKHKPNIISYKLLDGAFREHKVQLFERIIHQGSNRKIYYYNNGLLVHGFHFEDVKRVRQGFGNNPQPYIETLQTIKNAYKYPQLLNIIDDFCDHADKRKLLWLDKYAHWWENDRSWQQVFQGITR